MLDARTLDGDCQRARTLARAMVSAACLAALVLAGCDSADRSARATDAVGAGSAAGPAGASSAEAIQSPGTTAAPKLGTPARPAVERGSGDDSPQREGAGTGGREIRPELPLRRPRGLWVLCEGSQRVLDDPARIEPLLARATALGVSDLFVQVYRGGRAWYDASLADPAPFKLIQARSDRGLGVDDGSGSSADVLRELVARAHASGFRVHAWVNVLSLSLQRDAALIRELGREIVLVDRQGRSLLDYPNSEVPLPDGAWYRMGTRGVYLDAAAPGVADRLAAIFAELVTRYPELDGLHLDYIRYPMVLPIAPGSRFGVGLDFGYGAASRARFRRETGLRGPYATEPAAAEAAPLSADETSREAAPAPRSIVNSQAWDAWRRDQVTALVRKIGERVDAAHPQSKLLLSAAVIPYADRAYLAMGQDWRRWLEEGLLDFVVPMVYTKDSRLFRYQIESFAAGEHAAHVWAGHGTWLFERTPERAIEQLAVVAQSRLGGDALFSYDAIADSPRLLAELTAGLSAAREGQLESDEAPGPHDEHSDNATPTQSHDE